MNFDLVFEGGGAKGMVLVGAMQEFMEQEHTYDRLLGTSAGAITATFLAADYSVQELLAALNEKEDGRSVFASFMGDPPPFSEAEVDHSATLALLRRIDMKLVPNFLEDRVDETLVKALMKFFPNFFSFVERGGWYSAHKFVAWMTRKLDEGHFRGKPREFSQMTLAEFYAATERELSLVASDTTGERMLVLNHRTAPHLPVVWAVRMSMSIPLIWPEVEWQAGWGKYRDKDVAGHRLVDGGLLSNFPIELFLSDDPHITTVIGEKQSENVLGMLIDEALPVEGAPPPTAESQDSVLKNLQLIQRFRRLVNTATGAHDKMVIEAYEQRVVRLPAQGYGTTEFDMSDARREALVKAGRQTTRDYLTYLAGLPFGLSDEEMTIDAASHADRVAGQILAW